MAPIIVIFLGALLVMLGAFMVAAPKNFVNEGVEVTPILEKKVKHRGIRQIIIGVVIVLVGIAALMLV